MYTGILNICRILKEKESTRGRRMSIQLKCPKVNKSKDGLFINETGVQGGGGKGSF